MPGLLPARARATRPSGRGWSATRARSCTRRRGRTTSTYTGKKRGRHRLGRDRGHARAGHRRRVRPRDGAAALPDVLLSPAATSTSSPTRCARSTSRRSGPRDRPAQDPPGAAGDHAALVRASPTSLKEELFKGVREQLPEGYDVDTHFTPTYRPWQQRLAFVPDGDLFAGIRSGKASMVTDEIETFTETGIRTKSGERARRRHRHHCHRLRPERDGRHRRSWSTAGRVDFARHRHLPRHDVHRRAEHGCGSSGTSARAGRCGSTSSATSCAGCSAHGRARRRQGDTRAAPTRTRTCRDPRRGSTRRTSTPTT